jgi:hypothetical protein
MIMSSREGDSETGAGVTRPASPLHWNQEHVTSPLTDTFPKGYSPPPEERDKEVGEIPVNSVKLEQDAGGGADCNYIAVCKVKDGEGKDHVVYTWMNYSARAAVLARKIVYGYVSTEAGEDPNLPATMWCRTCPE